MMTSKKQSQETFDATHIEAQHEHLRQEAAKEAGKAHYVTWNGEDDPCNPLHFSHRKKISILSIICGCCLNVTCSSSVVSTAYSGIERDLNASEEVAILSLSLFVLGLAFGPPFIAPFSEFYGRRPIYLISFGAFFLLGFPVAFANNLPVLFIFRFLTGFAGSAFLTVAGGSIADLWTPRDTFMPLAFFTSSTFLGPVLGPVYGAFVAQFSSQWRWTLWVQTIWSFVGFFFLAAFCPETFGPIILTRKAKRLRRWQSGEEMNSEHEVKMAGQSVITIIYQNIAKIPILLALEPMLTLLCLWTAILLGIIYLFFEFFPLVFSEHGFNTYQNGLSFLGLLVGNMIALAFMPFWRNRFLKASKEGPASPEARLDPAKVGCFLSPAGLFIFAFTAYKHVHWIGPIIGSSIFSIGCVYIFFSVFNYTTANWRPVAASAMGANSTTRCFFAAAFPLFAVQMAHRLTNTGAAALLAGLNCLMIPIPFILTRYGPQIRARSRFTS